MKRNRASESVRYTLSELAQRAGVPPRTLRFYIARGLLPGPVQRGRYAMYGEEHLRRIEQIRQLQAEGLTLGQIGVRLSEATATPSTVSEGSRWRHFAVADDVVVMVREPSTPWRLHRVRTAIALLMKELDAESRSQRE